MARRRKSVDNGVIIFKEKTGEQISLFEGEEHPVYSERRIFQDKSKLLRRLNKNEGKL